MTKLFEIIEEWRDIPEYENLYQASNTGKIRSYDKFSLMPNGIGHQFYPAKELKRTVSNGYYVVSLFKNRKCKQFLVNRLVAMTFIPNPEKKPRVKVKDSDKLNCVSSNLEWSDRPEILKNAIKNRATGWGYVAMRVINTVTGEIFESTESAGKSIGMPRKTLNNMLIGIVRNKTNFRRL